MESAAAASEPRVSASLARCQQRTMHGHLTSRVAGSTSPGPLLDLVAARPRAQGDPILQCKAKQGDRESLVAVRLLASCCLYHPP